MKAVTERGDEACKKKRVGWGEKGRRRWGQKGAVARTKEGWKKGEKRRREWRSESKGRTACGGYYDGNVIR